MSKGNTKRLWRISLQRASSWNNVCDPKLTHRSCCQHVMIPVLICENPQSNASMFEKQRSRHSIMKSDWANSFLRPPSLLLLIKMPISNAKQEFVAIVLAWWWSGFHMASLPELTAICTTVFTTLSPKISTCCESSCSAVSISPIFKVGKEFNWLTSGVRKTLKVFSSILSSWPYSSLFCNAPRTCTCDIKISANTSS